MLRLFNRRQRAIERAARIVGAIYQPSAKPSRRFDAESEPEQPKPSAFALVSTFTYQPFAAGRNETSSNGWQRIA